jgi:hypothetical protein
VNEEDPMPDTANDAALSRRGRLGTDTDGAKIRGDLDRLFTEKAMARADSGEALARDMATAGLSLPSLADIDRALQTEEPAEKDYAQLLALDDVDALSVDGMRLNELLDRGISGGEERQMVKRGLLFLKRRMYPEAAEWWLLNRPEDEIVNGRLHLLLTLFLVLTYKLAGDEAAAQVALGQARGSRFFKRQG